MFDNHFLGSVEQLDENVSGDVEQDVVDHEQPRLVPTAVVPIQTRIDVPRL